MVADRLRRLNKPVVLVANKVESRWDEFSVHEWARIGFGDALAVSAVEGFGMSVLMDRIVDMLPEKSEAEELDHDETLRFSIVGKRNSGKSTLVNQLVGEDRVIVSEIPGTTRDAVDVAFEYENCKMIAIDTAGVRKKRSIQDAIEYYSYSRAVESIRRSSVVMHLFDITADISQVDKKLAAFCVENYRPSILVGNKVDLADDLELGRWDGYIRQQLKGLWYAPVIFASALDATNLSETLSIILDLRAQARTQIPTARLNEVLQEARNKLQPRNRGLIPKMFYATQVGTEPLTILIFVNEPRLFRGQYDRYLQNRLREVFDCREVPIKLLFRRREKVALDPLG
jgi:GTP-binding protein